MKQARVKKTKDFVQLLDDTTFDEEIDYVYAVRRPIDTPATRHKLGIVLSHSGCICVTKSGVVVLVEYMWGSKVHVQVCDTYKEGQNFVFERLTFVHDTQKRQSPSTAVTVREFAQTMADFMRGKSFATYTHNCHQARFVTMQKYGMESENPDVFKRNVFFQGVVDYFRAKRV